MAETEKLGQAEVDAELAETMGWSLTEGGEIERKFRFADFRETMLFVNAVAYLAESLNHHPDIHISYNRVTLSVHTHSAGGLTGLDFTLAREVNTLPELRND